MPKSHTGLQISDKSSNLNIKMDLWQPLPLILKFSEMLNPAPMSLNGVIESKTAFLSIFSNVVNFGFDLWSSNFKKCLTPSQ